MSTPRAVTAHSIPPPVTSPRVRRSSVNLASTRCLQVSHWTLLSSSLSPPAAPTHATCCSEHLSDRGPAHLQHVRWPPQATAKRGVAPHKPASGEHMSTPPPKKRVTNHHRVTGGDVSRSNSLSIHPTVKTRHVYTGPHLLSRKHDFTPCLITASSRPFCEHSN